MIIFPDNNLPGQSQDWADTVEREIKRIDKKGRPITTFIGGGDSGGGGGVGPAGPQGPTGPQGEQGPAGEQGEQGEQGPQGLKGDTGDQGLQGIQGLKGDTGNTGPKGDTGDTGATGATGAKGDTGDQGIQGIQGIQGLKGDTGEQGIQGPKGDTGDTGPQGIQGVKGDTGATGATGATGSQGPNGFSAYQVAQIEGFTGTEAEWLASLVGEGVPVGGTTGQILAKIDGTDYNTQWISQSGASYTSVVKHEVKLGEAIAKGQAVYVSSADGTNMIVSKASNASEPTSSKTMGLLETGGSTNAKVNVITEGLLSGLNTSTATAGDAVWLGTNGDLIFWHYGGSTTKPSAPAHLVFIGIVTRANANNGEIFVKPQNGFELNEIHDVDLVTNAPVDKDLLVYESATSLWKNKTLTQANIAQLAGGNSFIGAQTVTASSATQVPITLVAASGQTAHLLSTAGGARIPAAGNYFIAPGITATYTSDFNAGAAGVTPVTIKGAASQTASLTQWQNSAGSLVATMSAAGDLALYGNGITSGDHRVGTATYLSAALNVQARAATEKGAVIRGASGQSADLLQIQNSGGTNLTRFDQFGGMFAIYGNFLSDSTTTLPLRVRGAANQVEDLTEWQNSSNTVLGGVNANAQIFTGSNAPIQTAVGAGINGVTGNGTTVTFSTTNAHGLANGDRVTIAGLTPAGYNGTYIISGVSTFSFNIANTTTGTASGSGTVSVDAQTSITARSAGTIALQVKGATSQAADLLRFVNAGGTTLSWFNAGGSLFMGGSGTLISAVSGRAAFITNDSTQVPMLIRGASGQTADLLQVQDNAGTNYLSVNNFGSLLFGTGSGSFLSGANGRVNVQLSGDNIGVTVRAFGSQTADLLQFQTNTGSYAGGFERAGALNIQPAAALNGYSLMARAASASVVPVMVRGAASQSANLQEWQNSSGTIQARITSSGAFVTTSLTASSAVLNTGNAAVVPIIARGAASQTADLQQWQNSAGSAIARIDSGGNLKASNVATLNTLAQLAQANSGGVMIMGRATAQFSSPGANSAALYFRDGTTAGTLKLVVRAGAAGAETTILDNIPQ